MYKPLHCCLIAALGLAAGCAPPPAQDAPKLPAALDAPPTIMAEPPAEQPVDIGDVESRLAISLKLADGATAPGLSERLLDGRDGVPSLSTITVQSPPPPLMPIALRLRGHDPRWATTPVVVRGRVIRDGETTVDTFASVLAGTPTPAEPIVIVDAFKDFPTEVPHTQLLYAEAEVLLLPLGTDPATVDPATAEADANRRTIIQSNPVRVNVDEPSAP